MTRTINIMDTSAVFIKRNDALCYIIFQIIIKSYCTKVVGKMFQILFGIYIYNYVSTNCIFSSVNVDINYQKIKR